MKDNSLDGHRGKVAIGDTKLQSPDSGKADSVSGQGATNFDDDYNEWELGIGDLIIDLDADIEKNNEKNHLNGNLSTISSNNINACVPGVNLNPLSGQVTVSGVMSNSKTSRMGVSNSGSGNSTCLTAVEHQATVDKGLKMKIKRKNIGSKYSEAKHEIVQSDTKANSPHAPAVDGVNLNSNQTTPTLESKSKHSSSKGRSSSHRDKKEKNRDKEKEKDKSKVAEVNGVIASPTNSVVVALPPASSLKITNSGVNIMSPTVQLGMPTTVMAGNTGSNTSSSTTTPTPTTTCNNTTSASHEQCPTTTTTTTTVVAAASAASSGSAQTTNCNPSSMPNLTVKLEAKFSPGPANNSVILKMDELPKSPPAKRVKLEENLDSMDDNDDSSNPTEFKETSTCTSIGTITEPECLGPCEPGTSVLLEGIVWQETEGGVLVVNVTWRGKTYVGTLLDCTKHDWAPPRFCESPTSDMDAKAVKGRGKRGRGSASASTEATGNATEPRTCVQSKLRNGKGRRNASSNSGFTVPNSPARTENGLASKRKTRPIDLELSPVGNSETKSSKRSRSQSRNPLALGNNVEFPQPSSPLLIECPEPNCNKKYKHINGLRYHQTHAHSNNESGRMEDMNLDEGKDTTNSSDNEESLQEGASVPTSPVTPFTRSSSPTVRTLLPSVEPATLTPSSSSEDVDNFTSDLSTLASVAISESTTSVKSSSPVICFNSVTSTSSISSSTDSVKSTTVLSKLPAATTTSLGIKTTPSVVVAQSGTPLQTSVSSSSSSTNTVIQSSTSVVMPGSTLPQTPSVTVSIPTLHVMSFNQTVATASITSTLSNSLPDNNITTSSAMRSAPLMSSNTVIAPVVASLASTGVSVPLSIDKSKLKQEKLDRHKTTQSLSTVRPVLAVSTNIPPPTQPNATGGLSSTLKPIQPKPTVLGEPMIMNPSLENLKKEKSKHKKKSKDKEKKSSGLSVDGKSHPQCSDGDRHHPLTYHVSENLSSSRENVNGSLGGTTQSAISSLDGSTRSLDLRVESNASENSLNENVQSPAYSDISDANDTAPILESEVPSEKEKDEKTMKPTSENTPSPSSNLPYGMYSYYGQPPYLIPSVPPQNEPSPTATNGERSDPSKKMESERHKDIKVWSAQSEIEKVGIEQKQNDKKATREENVASSAIAPPVPSTNTPLQEFPIQQSYPYPYGYMQGYPYGVDPAYHMHLLANDPHYKQQHERLLEEQLYKEQTERRVVNQQPQNPLKDDRPMVESNDRNAPSHVEMAKRNSPPSMVHSSRDRDMRDSGPVPLAATAVVKLENPPSIHSPVTSLKEKQSENHQILKENIELKSQMDSAKSNFSHYEAAAILERQREEMRRYLILQEHLLEQQQKMEPEPPQPRPAHFVEQQPLSRKERESMSGSSNKNSSLETRASNCVSPLKSDMNKASLSANAISSSPKGSIRESHGSSSKDSHHISSTISSANKKDSANSVASKISENSETKDDKSKSEKSKIQSEGQKPTMETTGPPPPPTNSYAYLHPSYLQAPPQHFAPMAFDHGHPMYRSGISPIIMSAAPPYGSSPYLHQQLRYHVPTGPCDLAHHAQPGQDPMAQKLHAPGPPKALDLLHQVSQHYTTHKIHELQERALMSPTSTSAPVSTSAAGVQHGKVAGSELTSGNPLKQEASSSTDRNRSPPPQRHLHTHHHTHVGVGYPLYDPYGVNQQWKQAQAQRRVPFRLTQ